jgi:hypothetical protein
MFARKKKETTLLCLSYLEKDINSHLSLHAYTRDFIVKSLTVFSYLSFFFFLFLFHLFFFSFYYIYYCYFTITYYLFHIYLYSFLPFFQTASKSTFFLRYKEKLRSNNPFIYSLFIYSTYSFNIKQ